MDGTEDTRTRTLFFVDDGVFEQVGDVREMFLHDEMIYLSKHTFNIWQNGSNPWTFGGD
jgi:hypothetical protein